MMYTQKRKAAGFLLAIVALVFSIGVAEIGARFLYTKEERTLGVKNLFNSSKNGYTHLLNQECGFADSLTPHPYLAFVHHNVAPCGSEATNNIGILQKVTFPYERDPHFFSVLVVGGSVASALSMENQQYASWLQEALNHYRSPNGKPFRVLSGAVGSWGVPLQLNIISLYGDVVDAIVAIDGYNEAMQASYNVPITSPDTYNYFYVARPRLLGNYQYILSLARFFRRLGTVPPWSSSYLVLTLYHRSLGLLESPQFRHVKERALERFFRFPFNVTNAGAAEWNRKKYENYIHLLAGQARALEIPYIHFVQPMKDIGKTLSAEEAAYKSEASSATFRKVILRASENARAKGLHSFSLENVFATEKDTIYSDGVHCRYEAPGKSRGYTILANAMAKQMAKVWKLAPLR